MLKKVLSLVLVLVMLSSSVVPVMAASDAEKCSCGACEITLKRVVEVELAKNGKTILNVTEINQSLSEWFAENFEGSFSCADGSCLAFDYQVETKELFNSSTDSKMLRLLEVRVYNETFSKEFKMLGYFSETATYNFSLVTRIMEMDGENYFVTTINIAPKNDRKFAPFADIIEIKSKTTLAEHYRILAKVLNEIRSHEETNWVWNKAKNELNYLSRVVERDLSEYNVRGYGWAVVIDSICTDYCSFICGIAIGSLCTLASGGVGALLCILASGVGCGLLCPYVCQEYPDLGSMTCSTACSAFFSAVCKYFKLSPLCEKVIANLGVCTWACSLA